MRLIKESRQAEILDAAIAVAAQHGLDAVSMRSVAERVGLTPMALYGYFRSKEELLDGLLGRLIAEIPPPPPGLGWRQAVEHAARGARTLAARYPTVVPLLLTRPAVSPAAVRFVDTTYRILLAAGVPPAEVPRLERMLSTFLIGHVVSEVSGRFGAGTLDPPARRAQLPPDDLPGHHALARHLDAPVDWSREFHTNLREMCDLVERHISGPPAT